MRPQADGPVVFLDRDGTLNRKAPEGEYVTGPEQLDMLPGAAEAVATLNRHGLRVVVVTNQRGVALGRMSEADVAAVHERLSDELGAAGGQLEAVYYCPHELGTCECRKPATGMFRRAARDLGGVRFEEAVMVGDALSDVQAGAALRMRTVLLAPGGVASPNLAAQADHVAASLQAAASWIVGSDERIPRSDDAL